MRILLSLTIKVADQPGRLRCFLRQAILPFVPQIGMDLRPISSDKKADDDIFTVTGLQWVERGNYLIVDLKDEGLSIDVADKFSDKWHEGENIDEFLKSLEG